MFEKNIRVYLNSNVKVLTALSLLVCSDKYSDVDSINVKVKIIDIIINSENNVLDFIDSFGIVEIDVFTVNNCLGKLIKINKQILGYTEKLQSQGYKLAKVIHALKLENANIKAMML